MTTDAKDEKRRPDGRKHLPLSAKITEAERAARPYHTEALFCRDEAASREV